MHQSIAQTVTWQTTTRQAARLEESLAGTQLSVIDVRFRVPWECVKADLDAAAADLVSRHDALRTEFASSGGAWIARIHPPRSVQVTLFDGEFVRPPHLERSELPGLEPPLIWFFATQRENRFYVVLLVEHSVCDGDSVELLVRDFLGLLAARTLPDRPALSPVTGRSFGDFALEEREILDSAKFAAAQDAWVRMFGSVPVTKGVPAGYWSPHLAGELRSERTSLGRTDLEALETARKTYSATTAAVLLAAVASAFMEQFDSADFVCTVPVKARTKRDVDTVGCYINLMPLRVSWPPDADPAVRVERARKALVNLLVHRAVPGVKILEDPRLSDAEQPDAPVVFIQGAETTEVDVLGHRIAVDDGNGTREELGLTVRVVEGAAAYLAVDHDPGRFEPEIPGRILQSTRKWIALLATAAR